MMRSHWLRLFLECFRVEDSGYLLVLILVYTAVIIYGGNVFVTGNLHYLIRRNVVVIEFLD